MMGLLHIRPSQVRIKRRSCCRGQVSIADGRGPAHERRVGPLNIAEHANVLPGCKEKSPTEISGALSSKKTCLRIYLSTHLYLCETTYVETVQRLVDRY